MRNPAVPVAERPSRRMRNSAADDNRRPRLLHRLRPAFHPWELNEFTMVLGLVLGPDRIHRLNAFAHQLEAGLKGGAVISHLLRIPAAADTEQKPPAGDQIDRRDQFGSLDHIAL